MTLEENIQRLNNYLNTATRAQLDDIISDLNRLGEQEILACMQDASYSKSSDVELAQKILESYSSKLYGIFKKIKAVEIEKARAIMTAEISLVISKLESANKHLRRLETMMNVATSLHFDVINKAIKEVAYERQSRLSTFIAVHTQYIMSLQVVLNNYRTLRGMTTEVLTTHQHAFNTRELLR